MPALNEHSKLHDFLDTSVEYHQAKVNVTKYHIVLSAPWWHDNRGLLHILFRCMITLLLGPKWMRDIQKQIITSYVWCHTCKMSLLSSQCRVELRSNLNTQNCVEEREESRVGWRGEECSGCRQCLLVLLSSGHQDHPLTTSHSSPS